MRESRKFLVALGVILALSLPLLAQQPKVYREGNAWVEETGGSISPVAKALIVRLNIGSVVVQGNPQASSINYTLKKHVYDVSEETARRAFDQLKLSPSRTTNNYAVLLKAETPTASTYHVTAELVVQVPRDLDFIKVENRAGNIAVNSIGGRLVVVTGGGSLQLNDIGGHVRVFSGGGDVNIGTVNSDVDVKTDGGNIRIESAKGFINTVSGGGAICIKRCGQLKASTVGGSLDLGQVSGSADVKTGGGSIRISSATGPVVANSAGGRIELMNLSQSARVDTGNGDIVAEFLGTDGFAGSSLDTPFGNITVYLGKDLKATIQASIDMANGHAIVSDFPGMLKVTSEGGQYGPKSAYAEGNLNGGGPILKVHTTNGNILFRRAKK